MEQNFIENELIIISKATSDAILKEENPADVMALYWFYYYTAKWQQTNQPKALDCYVMKGLGWGLSKLRKAKKTLLKLKLISIAHTRDDKKQITGWYIKLNYIWKIENVTQVTSYENEKLQVAKATSSFQDTNALSVNTLNALSANTKALGSDIKKLITRYNEVQGFTNKDEYGSYSRQSKTAKEIMKAMNYKIEDCIKLINYVGAWAKQNKLSWTLETCIKRIDFYYKEKNRINFIKEPEKRHCVEMGSALNSTIMRVKENNNTYHDVKKTIIGKYICSCGVENCIHIQYVLKNQANESTK